MIAFWFVLWTVMLLAFLGASICIVKGCQQLDRDHLDGEAENQSADH